MIEILCVIVGALIAVICMKIEKVFDLLESRSISDEIVKLPKI